MSDYQWDNFERPEEQPAQRSKGSGWWVTSTSGDGRLVLIGAYNTEEEATGYGFSKLGNSFEVIWLPTRDQARATRMAKKQMFDRVGNLDKALQRAHHKVD